jgi:hypothetical protein
MMQMRTFRTHKRLTFGKKANCNCTYKGHFINLSEGFINQQQHGDGTNATAKEWAGQEVDIRIPCGPVHDTLEEYGKGQQLGGERERQGTHPSRDVHGPENYRPGPARANFFRPGPARNLSGRKFSARPGPGLLLIGPARP